MKEGKEQGIMRREWEEEMKLKKNSETGEGCLIE